MRSFKILLAVFVSSVSLLLCAENVTRDGVDCYYYYVLPSDAVVSDSILPKADRTTTITEALSKADIYLKSHQSSKVYILVTPGKYTEQELIINKNVYLYGSWPYTEPMALKDKEKWLNHLGSLNRKGFDFDKYLTIIDANFQNRVATVRGYLCNCNIINGYVSNSATNNVGGAGVLIDGGVVEGCIIKGCAAVNVNVHAIKEDPVVGAVLCADGSFVIMKFIKDANNNDIIDPSIDFSKLFPCNNKDKRPVGVVSYAERQGSTKMTYHVTSISQYASRWASDVNAKYDDN